MDTKPFHQTEAADRGGSSRRTLLRWAVGAFGGLAAAAVGVPVVGYLLAPIVRWRRDQWVDAGDAESFTIGATKLVSLRNPVGRPWDGSSGKVAAYVRRLAQSEFVVFAVNCTHLGCPVSWFPQSGLFLCPCHGGVYYADGSRASGPPPRGLYQLPHQVARGRLRIQVGHFPTLAEPA
jgi:menaquinol-cytochrome c reductase iron-sulfur subunit